MRLGLLAGRASLVGLSLATGVAAAVPAVGQEGGQEQTKTFEARCAAIGASMQSAWPDPGTRLVSSVFRISGPAPQPQGPPGMAPPAVQLPAHCEVVGAMRERAGLDGQNYAIRFHLRLPEGWNGRLFFQGGGGTNGELGDAIGHLLGGGMPPALAQGYAVLSQDLGHDNAVNTVAGQGGATAFGFDPQARADYGGASLAPVTLAAKALVSRFYGEPPSYSYFVGCSKGGQEGMVLAQRHPELFDGIVAAAPGFALPRAALAEAWNTQAFAEAVRANGQTVTLASLGASFSDTDLALVRNTVLDACDGDDGVKDGIVGAFRQCTSAKVLPALERRTCSSAKTDACLSQAQISALQRIHDGPRNRNGERLYPGFPWDGGWSDMGWRIWMIGSADGRIPPINVAMGAPALAAIFTTPPQATGPALQAALDYALGFDFDRDAPRIHATSAQFSRSAWQDIGARSSDLDGFRKRGGKLIVPHGVSDPVFSIDDTLDWWTEVDVRYGGKAADFVRVFPVPGMNHCSGGPATDRFDAFGALVAWVERGEHPGQLPAKAGLMSPWPGREGLLCPYPKIARPALDVAPGTGQAAALYCDPQ